MVINMIINIIVLYNLRNAVGEKLWAKIVLDVNVTN